MQCAGALWPARTGGLKVCETICGVQRNASLSRTVQAMQQPSNGLKKLDRDRRGKI
jgi:hypothetical protein